MKNLSAVIGAFVFGALVSVLLLANYSGYDFLSNYHNESYLLKNSVQIKDATNNKILNLPKGIVVKLHKDYEGSAVVSTEFIIEILELEKIASKQEKQFPNRYWYEKLEKGDGGININYHAPDDEIQLRVKMKKHLYRNTKSIYRNNQVEYPLTTL